MQMNLKSIHVQSLYKTVSMVIHNTDAHINRSLLLLLCRKVFPDNSQHKAVGVKGQSINTEVHTI